MMASRLVPKSIMFLTVNPSLYVIGVLDDQIKKKYINVRCRTQCDDRVPLGTGNTLREILYKCKLAGPYTRDKKTKYQWYSQFILIFRGLVINRLLIYIYKKLNEIIFC
jgi:hypothetical protein